ncbi:hypothetical protein TEA_023686 [Camellia sinensis var. sinensis]|uniref:Protein kinase domain-containing protein n=1 Tax=Camellia sinensis var. sinensis TaxID=542762 RepID=A0A4S4DVE8_CAMSN|nr:hypothetical protein TEA_023686 [Camellia sinensis var. sinensis]
MANGNLCKCLHQVGVGDHRQLEEPRNFKLLKRLDISVDVTSALECLHCGCESTIIHGHLKPSNVLLDDGMTAHIGDFGLAKIISTISSDVAQGQSNSNAIRGTIGYVAPRPGCDGAGFSKWLSRSRIALVLSGVRQGLTSLVELLPNLVQSQRTNLLIKFSFKLISMAHNEDLPQSAIDGRTPEGSGRRKGLPFIPPMAELDTQRWNPRRDTWERRGSIPCRSESLERQRRRLDP